jgi:hypothetical protein
MNNTTETCSQPVLNGSAYDRSCPDSGTLNLGDQIYLEACYVSRSVNPAISTHLCAILLHFCRHCDSNPYQRHSFNPQCNNVLAPRLTLIRFIGLICGQAASSHASSHCFRTLSYECEPPLPIVQATLYPRVAQVAQVPAHPTPMRAAETQVGELPGGKNPLSIGFSLIVHLSE